MSPARERRRFDWVGRTYEDDEGHALAGARIAANATTGAGLIACFRPTVARTRCFSFAVTGASQGVSCGLATGNFLQVINSAGAASVAATAVTLNAVNVVFAWWDGASSRLLAVNSIRSLEAKTDSVSLFATTSLCVGQNDQAGGARGDYVGDFYWIGALKALPPKGLLGDVLAQQRPPTILWPWLAHLVPFLGNGADERCIVTGQTMALNAGTVPAATRRGVRPQAPGKPLQDGLGRATRRYTLSVSHGGDSQTILSITAEADDKPDAVIVKVPSGSDRAIGIGVNGPVAATATLPADPNPQSGDLVLGAGISAGTAASGTASAEVMGWLANASGDAAAQAGLVADAQAALAPKLETSSLSGPIATDNTIDLATIVDDPGGYGWSVDLAGDPSDDLTLRLAGTVLTYRADTAGTYPIRLRFTSLHPIAAVVELTLTAVLTGTGVTFPNGYKYRRLITRKVQGGIAAGRLTRFPVPVRIVAQDWARSVANGGKLEAATAIDLRLETTGGALIDFELRPGSDLAAGTHTLIVSRDTDPSVLDTFWLYYGKRIAISDENPAATWQDYWHVYTGGANSRNPADLFNPWDVADVGEVPGNLDVAGDFVATTAEATQASSASLNGLSKIDVMIHLRRRGGIGGGPDGYEHVADINLPIWDAAGGSAANFLLPFSVTLPDLRTVANGGKVRSANGWDIRFETVTGTKLAHKDIAYDGAAGSVVKLINMPRDFTAAETIRIYIGNAGLTASEEDVTGARAGGWLAWYAGSGVDRSGNGRNLTATGGPPDSLLFNWPSKVLNGTNQYLAASGAASWLNGLSAVSVVAYHDLSGWTAKKYEVFNIASASEAFLSLHHNDAGNERYTFVAKFGTAGYQYQSQDGSASCRAIAVRAQAGQAITMAGDGFVLPAGSAATPTAGTLTAVSDNLEWGRGGRGDLQYWDGNVAFLGFCAAGLSNAALSAMTAAFENGSVRTVYTLGAFAAIPP